MTRKMDVGFSLSLDLIRFSAALVVFLAHFSYSRITGDWLWQLAYAPFAHHAVVIFFVLSGLVMAYVVQDRENTAYKFFCARFTRLSSVVIPMLIVVPILDFLGQGANPVIYDGRWFQGDNPVMRIVTAITFLHESWFSSTRYFSNGPYWSIAYEFWYYAAFGAMCFLNGFRRWVAVGVIVLVAGPKIFLLFPVWLLGVATWHGTRYRIPAPIAATTLILCTLCYGLWVSQGLYLWFEAASVDIAAYLGVSKAQLGWSSRWLADYFFGILIAIAFISLANLSAALSCLLSPVQGTIRWLAGATFTIYLLHYPLMHFLAAVFPGAPDNPIRIATIWVVLIVTMLAFAEITEKRKRSWANAIDRMVSALKFRSASS